MTVRRTHLLATLALLSVVLVAIEGCTDKPTCDDEGILIDNRDGRYDDYSEADYFCIHLAEEPLPEPPDLNSISPPDPPGPKDPEAVAKATIFVESCLLSLLSTFSNINSQIDDTYSAIMGSSLERAIAERVNCFKDKTNGCDAIRECLGMAITTYPSYFDVGCTDGIGLQEINWTSDTSWYLWSNCEGLGLECSDGRCVLPYSTCDATTFVPSCTEDNAPRNCQSSFWWDTDRSYQTPSCASFGLTCTADANAASCTGLGPACDETFDAKYMSYMADFRAGIACEDKNTLRACVNGHEQLVDCTAQGQGFSCIGGSRPRCGLDFQCDEVETYADGGLGFDGPTCDGSILRFCNSGVVTKIDCKSLGFKTCDWVHERCMLGPEDAAYQWRQ